MLLVSILEEMLAKGSAEVLAGAGFGALNVLGVKPEGLTLGVNPEGLERAAPKGSVLFGAVEVAVGTEIFGAAWLNGSLFTTGALGGGLLLRGSLRKSRSSSFSLD